MTEQEIMNLLQGKWVGEKSPFIEFEIRGDKFYSELHGMDGSPVRIIAHPYTGFWELTIGALLMVREPIVTIEPNCFVVQSFLPGVDREFNTMKRLYTNGVAHKYVRE